MPYRSCMTLGTNSDVSSPYQLFQCILDLVGIVESLKSLDGLASSSSSLICAVELEVQGQSDDNDQRGSQHTGDDTWVVRGLVLLSENSASNDATNAAEADEGCRAQGSLPLSSNVVRLPGEDGRDVRVAG